MESLTLIKVYKDHRGDYSRVQSALWAVYYVVRQAWRVWRYGRWIARGRHPS